MSKRRVDVICASDESRPLHSKTRETVQTHRTQDHPKPKPKPKSKPCDKPDARLQHLDSLHEKTNVKGHLKIPNDHRIKVDDQCAGSSDSKQMGRRKVAPSFNFDFVNLHDGKKSSKLDMTELSDSDTDLPNPQEILDAYDGTAKKTGAFSDPDTNYSNSEIDALIRNVQLPDFPVVDNLNENSPSALTRTRQSPVSPPAWITLSPSPTGKRKAVEGLSPPPLKRSRISDKQPNISRTLSPHLYTRESPSHFVTPSKPKSKKEPLFITVSSDEEDGHDDMLVDALPNREDSTKPPPHCGSQDDEEFVLDVSFFDIIPSTPPLTAATTSASLENNSEVSGFQLSSLPPAIPTRDPVKSGSSNLTKRDAQYGWGEGDNDPEHSPGSYHKEFAELDEWLNSGMVVIGDM